MSTPSTMKALTLRLAPELYNAIASQAKKQHQSVNAFIQKSLEDTMRCEEERARYDAYTILGQDADECDVEYAIRAQAEVMLRDEL